MNWHDYIFEIFAVWAFVSVIYIIALWAVLLSD